MTLALLTPCHDGMYHTNYMDLVMYAAGKPGFKLMKSEYESEDYAFCLDAGALSYKCWLDRCIRLTHRGFTLYKA